MANAEKADRPVLDVEDLPAELKDYHAELEKALDRAMVKETFPEGEKYPDAAQPGTVAAALVNGLRRDLLPFRIAYLFRQNIGGQGGIRRSKSAIAPAKWKKLAEVDGVVEVNWTVYLDATPAQRVRIVHEALAGFEVEESSGNPVLRKRPAVSVYPEILSGWGAESEQEREVVSAAQQLRLI